MLETIMALYAIAAALVFLFTVIFGLAIREHWEPGDTVFMHFIACFCMGVIWPLTIWELVQVASDREF